MACHGTCLVGRRPALTRATKSARFCAGPNPQWALLDPLPTAIAEVGRCFRKGPLMSRWLPALLLTAALALPAPAQTQEPPKTEARKAAIPPNTFFKGQTSSQYLAGEQLIGAKVTDKDGQSIGTISDLIVGSGDKIEGVVLSVGGVLGVGEKKIGVRLGALKLAKAEGKLAVSLPSASKEILAAVPAYEKAGGAFKK